MRDEVIAWLGVTRDRDRGAVLIEAKAKRLVDRLVVDAKRRQTPIRATQGPTFLELLDFRRPAPCFATTHTGVVGHRFHEVCDEVLHAGRPNDARRSPPDPSGVQNI
jgi:hypothetical protein